MECITLTDEDSGASARVLAGYGFNCFSFTVLHQDRPLDVLWAEEGFQSGELRASGSGIPVLFPFPGRIAKASFCWQDQTYSLPAGDGRGNAIHGFVLDRPWRVIEQETQRVVGQFQASVDAPEILVQWPADFRITVSYELQGTTLRSTIWVENPGEKRLPCGLGTHPYFRLPLGGTSADQCLIQLPVTRRWELREMLPTGRQSELDDSEGYQSGLRFGDMKFDDVFTGLVFDHEVCEPAILDPQSGLRLTMPFDQSFRECVVYTPPHREAVCIEPYTCLPGALGFDLGEVETGLRILEPGASFTSRVDLTIKGGGEKGEN